MRQKPLQTISSITAITLLLVAYSPSGQVLSTRGPLSTDCAKPTQQAPSTLPDSSIVAWRYLRTRYLSYWEQLAGQPAAVDTVDIVIGERKIIWPAEGRYFAPRDSVELIDFIWPNGFVDHRYEEERGQFRYYHYSPLISPVLAVPYPFDRFGHSGVDSTFGAQVRDLHPRTFHGNRYMGVSIEWQDPIYGSIVEVWADGLGLLGWGGARYYEEEDEIWYETYRLLQVVHR